MRLILTSLVLSVLLSVQGFTSKKIVAYKNSHSSQFPLLSSYHQDFLNILTLGHRRAYDDYLYIWLLQEIIQDQPLEGDFDDIWKKIQSL